jgi:LPXTG-motif cell wall-anchored protein
MLSTRHLTALLAALALLSPASALASAGDDQYVDPFAPNGSHHTQQAAGQSGTQGQGSQTQGTGSTSSTGTTSGTAPATSSASTQSAASSSGVRTTSAKSGKLAYTGSEPWLLLLAGAVLVGSGVALRRRHPVARRWRA